MVFTHLHLHTQYSLLDGACSIKPLMTRLKALNMKHCAITDHGALYGAVDFYEECLKNNIHPIIGCEVYICPDMDDKQVINREYSHLILLCENNIGYKNLIKLSSESFIRGYYYKPRIDYKLLEQHAEGLICLSACLSGDLPKLLLQNQKKEAIQYVKKMKNIFGKERFYIEIMDHGIPEQKRVLPALVDIANETDTYIVATNDAHYLTREDAKAQEILMCIQTGKMLSDENRLRMETQELYVKSSEEMESLFALYPEAIKNTQKIAEMCNITFDFKTIHLPKYPVQTGEQASELLKRLCFEGLKTRYPVNYHDKKAEPYKRLSYELDTIISMGYSDYFLIVWDFIDFAKRNNIMVGPGRGSGAGSIVAYVLNITDLDPLKYHLLFERFLNPERISMPDLDIDFCYERRQEVIDYVANKYGEDRVAQIITFGTMAARAVVRDVGRVLGMSYKDVDTVAKMIPFELNMTLKKALSQNPSLNKNYEENIEIKNLIDISLSLEGMPRHASTHAAGVLITHRPVQEYVPLQKNDDIITTQFPMGTLEQLGLLKMDFLGLRTLTVIRNTIDVLEERGIKVDVEDIPLNDPKVYAMISKGDTDGVFQLESSGMRSFLTNMKPQNFEDIIAAISLYRPGPMESIPKYIQGKEKPETVTYLTPKLKPILDVTYGCIVYQEQVMQIVRSLAGYSLARSDLMRRAMSKKKHDIMAEERKHFIYGMTDEKGDQLIPGCINNGISEKIANQIFDEMVSFASYAFNKSHAAAYGVLAIQTAWLKYYYPQEFMAAMINSVYGNSVKIAAYIDYCKRKGIAMLAPSINYSGWNFKVENREGENGIRIGLGLVKNLGQNTVENIGFCAKEKPFESFFDFVQRIDINIINKRALESMIKAGCFDELELNRAQLLDSYERILDHQISLKKNNIDGQVSLFDFGNIKDELNTTWMDIPHLKEFPKRTLLSMEKEIMGIYTSGHPLDEYSDRLSVFEMTIRDLREIIDGPDHGLSKDGMRIVMGGILQHVKSKATKRGQIMAFTDIEDLTGQIECLIFPKIYEQFEAEIYEDALVVIVGRFSVREEEEPKILIEAIYSLEEYLNTNKRLTNNLDKNKDVLANNENTAESNETAETKERKLYLRCKKEDMIAIESILKRHKGTNPVFLHFFKEKKTFLAPGNWRCSCNNEAIKELEALLGKENIKIV